ncbi:MAG: hypothetical protein K2Y22_06760 [Candidatus Obscuribacterales bacterium]|nr:hypothetical protein [Candidatus Obscuribacterales bacterium]
MPKSSKKKKSVPNWTWYGYEIHGNHQIDTKTILRNLPKRRFGRRIDSTMKSVVEEAGNKLQEKYTLPFSGGVLFRFIGQDNKFTAIGVIDVVEKGDEHRCTYRAINDREITLANEEILELQQQLYTRIFNLFEEGVAVRENYDQNFLDIPDDPECHKLCVQLAELVPSFKQNILEVIEFHPDEDMRSTAANLLCWTKSDLEGTIAQVHHLLDDPSSSVRNNISRFMLPYVARIYGAYIKHPLIKNLLKQLDRPSHYDRNKAIYCLLSIAKASAFLDRQYIKSHGEKLIRKIAETSLMPNVQEPAEQLLALFNANS